MTPELEFAIETVKQAGDLLVGEAGGRSTDGGGEELSFANPVPRIHGIVAANQKVHSAALAWLKANEVQKT
jgi:fructose-1,6-bisphosphatase/inositol monophosphatase family enzyme